MSGIAHASDEVFYQKEEVCGKCPKAFDPGPVTSEKDLCTTNTPYKYPVGEVTVKIQGNTVTGRFEFWSYRLFGEDVHHLYCQGFRSISGDFSGILKGDTAVVRYQHSWNEAGDTDSAEIRIGKESIQWRSVGLQHGYLGMIPSSMNLALRKKRVTHPIAP
ncbi:MAG: hypothetical protein H6R10_3232 [Rhodocyclaceae bacterium]|nr:hypothetical protein [Rhodocyclaceae bacterium]